MIQRRSTVQNKILTYFFLNEQARVYINELARIIDADPKNVYRILMRLEEDGVLVSEFKGKERYFRANRASTLYKSYKDVFMKTAGLESLLRQQLKRIAGLEHAYIFGSYAAQKFGPESDIDVLLVGTHTGLAAEKIIHAIQKHVGREIIVVNMTPDEFKRKRAHGDQLLSDIFAHKVIQIL